MSHKLPALVCKLGVFDGWLVGSSSKRDYDVLVPLSRWQEASQLITADAKPNTFGGWKCQSENAVIDVWPGELTWLAINKPFKQATHIQTGITLIKA